MRPRSSSASRPIQISRFPPPSIGSASCRRASGRTTIRRPSKQSPRRKSNSSRRGRSSKRRVSFLRRLWRARRPATLHRPDSVGSAEALAAHYRHLEIWAAIARRISKTAGCCSRREIARLEGRTLDAEQLYENAIRLAALKRLRPERGSRERGCRASTQRAASTIAGAYLRKARDCCVRWGAEGKVRQLEQSHPFLARKRHLGPTTTIGRSVERWISPLWSRSTKPCRARSSSRS